MNKKVYYSTLTIFYICKLFFFLQSLYLFYFFILTDEYLVLMLAILYLYGSFLFYGFEIRFKKMLKEDMYDDFHNLLYKDMSRRARRKTLKSLRKK